MTFRYLLAAFLGLGVLTSYAADRAPESSPAPSAGGAWLASYPEAIKDASAENRLILANFTGSDWCPWCVRLVKDTFSQPAFLAFAKDNLVLLELDFPRAKEQSPEIKKQNEGLQEKFGVEGFPTLVLMDKDGREIARNVGYLAGGPEAMIAWVRKAQAKP